MGLWLFWSSGVESVNLVFFTFWRLPAWASVIAQLVENPPAVRETWVWLLGWEDPLEKGKAAHASILANSMDSIVNGIIKSQTWLSDFHFHFSGATCFLCLNPFPFIFKARCSAATFVSDLWHFPSLHLPWHLGWPLPPSYNYCYDYTGFTRH